MANIRRFNIHKPGTLSKIEDLSMLPLAKIERYIKIRAPDRPQPRASGRWASRPHILCWCGQFKVGRVNGAEIFINSVALRFSFNRTRAYRAYDPLQGKYITSQPHIYK